MARYSETIDTTPQAIRDFAAGLRLVASAFEKQADTMQEFSMETIAVTHWKSAKKGVAGFSAFAGAIQDAILASKVSGHLDSMPISAEDSAKIAAKIAGEKEPLRLGKGKTKRQTKR